LHAQGLLVADEVLCLLAGGYPSGAEARWRTLYELSVVARFIAGQADKVARRYKASHVVERWRGIRAGDLDYLMTEAPGEYSAYVQMVEREYNEIIRKYGASMDGSYGWATEALGQENATFHALATFVLGESKGDRWLRYTNASQHIHGVRLASVNAFQVSRDRRGPRYTPKPVGTYLPFMDMIDSIHSITHALGRTAYEVHEVPEIPYFDSVCGMVALDVRTEALRSWQEVDPGFLHRALGIAQHG
jgi:hypothetical protein